MVTEMLPSSQTVSRIAQLVEASLDAAHALDRGKLKPKFLGRSFVFRDNGSPCCIWGHVIQKAGLKGPLAPFRGRGFDGAKGTRWWSSEDATKHLLPELVKASLRDAVLYQKLENLTVALNDLEAYNDTMVGPARITAVVDGLKDTVIALNALLR